MSVFVSPCVKLCALDSATGLCVGCGRTLNEIGGWLGLSDGQRRAIIASLPARLGALAAAEARTGGSAA